MKRRAAHIILYDPERRFLLQHRTADAWLFAGYWGLFGGEVKKGEASDDAVCREAFEELNYNLNTPKLFIKQDFKLKDTDWHRFIFIDSFNGDKTALILQEGQGWGWFQVSEIGKLKMVDNDRHIIRLIAQYLKGT